MSRSRFSPTRLARFLGVAVSASALAASVLAGTAPAHAADLLSTASAPTAAPAAWDGTVPAGTVTTVTLPYGGTSRSYLLFAPTTVPTGPRPLVLALHYLNGTPTSMEYWTRFDVGAAALGAYVVYPAGISGSWNGGTCCAAARDQGVDDVGFLDAVLTDVQARVSVDPKRIAMGGFSNGAIMSYRYACSGATQVASYFFGSGVDVAPSCAFGRPLQLLHMHGTKDGAIYYNGSKTNTRFSDGLQPGIPYTFGHHETLLGCTGYAKTQLNAALTRSTATGCPAGSGSILMTSTLLDHRWANGPQASATYGIDETGTLWNWLQWTVWKKA